MPNNCWEPGILFQCPMCGEADFITTATLREIWDDDEYQAREHIGLESWQSLDELAMDKLSLLPDWVCCPKCREYTTLIESEDEEIEESGYGGTGMVIS